MRQGKTATARLIQRARGFRYSLVWEGIAVGAAAGLVTVLFRLLLSQGDALRQALGELLTGRPWLLPLWLVALLVLAALVTLLLRWEPLISGSGIPQVEGELHKDFSTDVLLSTMSASITASKISRLQVRDVMSKAMVRVARE